MEPYEIEALIKERVAEAITERQGQDQRITMMAIRPFNAWDEDDKEIQVIGVTLDGDGDMSFMAIREIEGGILIPTMEVEVYRTKYEPEQAA